MTNVYINSFGSFLPGEAIANKEMEDYLGYVGGEKSRNRALVLRQNRIKTRHYALNKKGQAQYKNCEMAANAIRHAVEQSEVMLNDIGYLATSTTLSDVFLPGLASHTHAALGVPPLEIASFQSVCASSLMALKSAYLQLKAGEHDCAAVCGSEFASRYFRPGFYEQSDDFLTHGKVSLDADFLRFTLSDGAGAAILERKPNESQHSFKIHWVDLRSFADRFETCMIGGGTLGLDDAWGDYGSPQQATTAGALRLTQDFDTLKEMIPVWVSHYLDLIDEGKIVVDEIDYLCSHYSAHSLREEAIRVLETTGAMIPEEKWYSNLYSRGNTGTASIFIMLEEFSRTVDLKKGQKILCHVPESGRCLNGLMLLEVV